MCCCLVADLILKPKTVREQYGSRTPEDPISAEKRQEAGRDQEVERPRPEDGGEGCAGVHVWSLQVTDAGSENVQAAFREQTSQKSSSSGAGGCGSLSVASQTCAAASRSKTVNGVNCFPNGKKTTRRRPSVCLSVCLIKSTLFWCLIRLTHCYADLQWGC